MKCSSSIVPVVPNKTTVVMPHCLSIGLILILGCEALSLNFVLKWIHFHFDYCRLCHALFFFFAHMPFYKPTDKNKSVSCTLVVSDVSETSQSATFYKSSFPEGKHSSDHDTAVYHPYCDQNRETQPAFDQNLKSRWPRCSASSVHDMLRLKPLNQKAPHSVKEGQNIPTRTKNIETRQLTNKVFKS